MLDWEEEDGAIVGEYITLISAIVQQARRDLERPCGSEEREDAEEFFKDGRYGEMRRVVKELIREFGVSGQCGYRCQLDDIALL